MGICQPDPPSRKASNPRTLPRFYADTGPSRCRDRRSGAQPRNALLEMIDYMVAKYGLTRQQAYIVASVAVDLRIGQLVDAPNVGVTAILPLDIFEGE